MRIILKPYRLSLRMSQAELASKAGVSKTCISKIERNFYIPSEVLLQKLAGVLNMCPYHLIDFCSDCPFNNLDNFFCSSNHDIRDFITKMTLK